MDKFLSCDWGTSSFRLRLVDASTMSVIYAVSGTDGIAVTYQRWLKESGKEDDRFSFFRLILTDHLGSLAAAANDDLQGLPLVISGMASSSIGMMELPYRELPFKSDGSDIIVQATSACESFPHELIIISGAKTGDDVLRGEETLVIGAEALRTNRESTYILPGTHSKHVQVVNGQAVSFRTYLTGEFFDLLSTQSILKNSVEKTLPDERFDESFTRGIREGSSANLLNIVFHVRTNQLFRKNSPSENYHYLSGLLIGSELSDIDDSATGGIVLVAGKNLRRQYELGLRLLSPHATMQFMDADEALVRGQLRICQALEKYI